MSFIPMSGGALKNTYIISTYAIGGSNASIRTYRNNEGGNITWTDNGYSYYTTARTVDGLYKISYSSPNYTFTLLKSAYIDNVQRASGYSMSWRYDAVKNICITTD